MVLVFGFKRIAILFKIASERKIGRQQLEILQEVLDFGRSGITWHRTRDLGWL